MTCRCHEAACSVKIAFSKDRDGWLRPLASCAVRSTTQHEGSHQPTTFEGPTLVFGDFFFFLGVRADWSLDRNPTTSSGSGLHVLFRGPCPVAQAHARTAQPNKQSNRSISKMSVEREQICLHCLLNDIQLSHVARSGAWANRCRAAPPLTPFYLFIFSPLGTSFAELLKPLSWYQVSSYDPI